MKIPANRWFQYPHKFSGGMRQRVASDAEERAQQLAQRLRELGIDPDNL